MIDDTHDVKNLLEAWGAWARDHHDGLGCKSPSQMLMLHAPLDEGEQEPKYKHTPPYISDDDALAVDKAVGGLARHSPLLWTVLRLRYEFNYSARRIAKECLTPLEYPCGKKQVHHPIASQMLERAVGVVEGLLLRAKIEQASAYTA